MKRFKQILAILDGSDRDDAVASRACILAKENKATLTFFEAVDIEVPIDELYFATTLMRPDFVDIAFKQARKRLDEMADKYRSEVSDIHTKLSTGTAFVEILRQVHEQKHDLVLISAEDEDSIVSRLVGSTCQRLLRKCPVPVWAIRPEHQHSYSRILAAVGLPHNNDNSLNDLIINLASSLAEMEQSELHIVHVWKPTGLPLLESDTDYVAQVDDWVDHVEAAHKQWFSQYTETLVDQVSNAQCHIMRGEPGFVIPQLAEDIGAELMVMGTVARSGVSGFLLGNTAEKVLHHAKTSLLTLKPTEFSSPIQFD